MKNTRAMMALAALAGIGCVVPIGEDFDTSPKRRPRNYDTEGPRPVYGPPTKPDPLTRQQRRWLERQAAKAKV